MTGFTDATPDRDQADVDEFGTLSDAGVFSQRLVLMAPPGLDPPGRGRVMVGPMKVILDDATLPSAAELASRIREAHGHGRGAAVHCVTADQLVVAVAAFEQAGPVESGIADRIEHAGIVPPGYATHLARLGLAVVTQPGFIQNRGDDYLRHVPEAERGWLYPCASLLRAGVPVAAGSDAPFGPANPWLAMAAAISRRTASGAPLGAAERVSAGRALRLYLAAPEDVRKQRRVAVGGPSDICILHTPMRQALADPASTEMMATIIGGRVVRTG